MSRFDGLAGAADMPACGGHFDEQKGKPVVAVDPAPEVDEPQDHDANEDAPLAAVRAIGERVAALVPDDAEDEDETGADDHLIDGAVWLFDEPDAAPALWGSGSRVLWSAGEALTISGPPGVGKTSVAAQVVSGSLGLRDRVLGFPVTECRRVLYLAMDRPAQARRNIRRFFEPEDRERLAGRLVIKQGPPWVDFAVDSDAFVELCARAGLQPGDRVVVDSIKDAAVGLSEDRVGAEYNRARQKVLTAGVDVLELHHMVKRSGDGPPKTLADVYGSQHITAGAGSVVLLHGVAGDQVVTLLHLKQPMDDVGPLFVTHDPTGRSTVDGSATDVVTLVRSQGAKGATATDVAVMLCDTSRPSRSQIEKARRRLTEAVGRGALVKRDGERGGSGDDGRSPTRWFLRAHGDENG
ncbi:AAA family ATPase [Gordonia sp. HS-NH1]|uniref:AAA family ATPase n=1 Tax=Gordonia sp. HS-NH1 TaxID=1435068 RepID=UPI0006E3FA02|nr:AAA family ATPase [Gordonia sp. HS-NH1]